MIQKSYKYRIYPKPKHLKILAKHFGCVRFIYNWGLETKIKAYETKSKSLNFFDTCNMMKQKKSELKWMYEVNSQSLQIALKNLDSAFTKFFREKKGFPRFKKKSNRQSFSCPQNVKVDFSNSTVKLPKIGEIKTVFDRTFKGKVKTCTVSKTPTNKYYISILVETPNKCKPKKRIRKKTSVGIDLGIKDFAILSNGDKIKNPKYYRKAEQRLKVLQRRASKKTKGSNNRKKANLLVAKQYEKIANKRKDFLHKLTTKLIRENQTICLEDLNVSGMMKNRKLSKSISDVSWTKFNEFLKYKAEWYGTNLVYIGRFEPSSKTCSVCGEIKKDLILNDRKWKCEKCDAFHDRDVNAAINIKKFALQKQNLIGTKNARSGRSGELLELSPIGGTKKEETLLH